MRRIQQLRSQGVTIVFVTHSVSEAMAIGERVLWMDRGQVAAMGDPGQVVPRYIEAMRGADPVQSSMVSTVTTIPNIDSRHGDGRARVLGIAVLNEFGEPLHLIEPESRIIVRISVRAQERLDRGVVGFLLRNHLGLDFASTSTATEGHPLPALSAGEVRTIDFLMEIPELYPGAFSFSPWIEDEGGTCDWIDNAITLQMGRGEGPVYGYLHWPTRVETVNG
jgi:hypothetical protein